MLSVLKIKAHTLSKLWFKDSKKDDLIENPKTI